MRIITFEDHVAHELERASSTELQEKLRRSTLILGELACVVALIALFLHRGWAVAAVLGGLALCSGAGYVYALRAYEQQRGARGQLRAGHRGQRLVVGLLSSLGDEYYLLNNLQLPGRNQDVDHLVVGPNGVFALETKHDRGRITWRDGQWYQSKISRNGIPQPEEPMGDPVRQLRQNIDYLRTCSDQTSKATGTRVRLWIEGVVVFTHPGVSIDLPKEIERRLPFPLLHGRDLPAFIVSHTPRQPYSRAEVRQIVSLFAHLEGPPP